ncbi:hypothetical protein [Gloeothece verrucosa]|uniref:Mto1-like Mto2p-binding domain-containing protein n=1 Tax=Gloeothece verrucosa (strain PCC 7822) TaxID=497965 RepID=E0UNL0_GLOV7|nr:hypothetical protein [Gloeothece verrucosa]ADN18540.1 conserved hypothetical protein [Gloeothece verrucosa PCC 7822]
MLGRKVKAKTIPLKLLVKIARLEKEVKTLKNELELEHSQPIPFQARNRLTELREENETLKRRIKD